MKTIIREDGLIELDREMLDKIGVKVGDQVELYVRDGSSITLVKAGTKRTDWDEWFETVTVIDFPDRDQPADQEREGLDQQEDAELNALADARKNQPIIDVDIDDL